MPRGVQRQVKRRKADKPERKVRERYEHWRQWYGIRNSVIHVAEELKMPRDTVIEQLGLDEVLTAFGDKRS